MRIIQIAWTGEDTLVALTDDGRIFTGFYTSTGFRWVNEITPDETKLVRTPLKTEYEYAD